VQVVDAAGETVLVADRGELTGSPAVILAGAKRLAITAWAGPWPLDERWWSADARRAWRVQAVDGGGCGWLLVLEAGSWWAEARYD
jgi:protein ImuB